MAPLRHNRGMRLLIAIAALAVLGASSAVASTRAAAPCRGTELTGSFQAVPNSAGAGNIVYTLRLHNASRATCFVTGIPGVQLLGKHGKPLPTHASPTFPGALTAILVTLAPGKSAKATARFSPDVPGSGEGHVGACERTSYRLRVTPNGGGTLIVGITPPTAVCEHGAMKFSALGFG